jgi:hypothetical protein
MQTSTGGVPADIDKTSIVKNWREEVAQRNEETSD